MLTPDLQQGQIYRTLLEAKYEQRKIVTSGRGMQHSHSANGLTLVLQVDSVVPLDVLDLEGWATAV